jgi:hypothetical protein
MATRDEIKAMVGYMKMAYPNYHPEIDGQVNAVDVLVDLLGDLPSDTLRIAVKAACAESGRQFAPSAGEIRGAATMLHAKASGMPEAGEAWGAIMQSFTCVKSQRPELLNHPLVVEAIRCMGGLDRIGMSEDNMADRAHFLKIYDALKTRALRDAAELPAATEYVASRQLASGAIAALTDKLDASKLLKGQP